jgi:hypothetical protein
MADNGNLASSLGKYASDGASDEADKKENIQFAQDSSTSSKYYIYIVGFAFSILLCWGAYRQFVLEPVKQEKYANERSKALAQIEEYERQFGQARSVLEGYYEKHAPADIAKVEALLDDHCCDEKDMAKLYKKIGKKYGAAVKWRQDGEL